MLRFHFILCHVIKLLRNSSWKKNNKQLHSQILTREDIGEKLMKSTRREKVPKSQTNIQPRESHWKGAVNTVENLFHGRRGRQ